MNNLHAAYASTRGLRRKENQDAVLFAPEYGLFVICDGMGGAVAGQEASQIAIAALDRFWHPVAVVEAGTMRTMEIKNRMAAAISEASRAVRATTYLKPEWSGMGSTVVVALRCGERLYVSNVGDSRAYLVRDGRSQLLTIDHTLAASLVAGGRLAPEALRSHPLRGHLTAFIGMEKLIVPACTTVQLQQGDRLVLCSDGIWERVEDDTLTEYISQASHPQQAADALIQVSLDCGGTDNASVIVLFTSN
jgi:PPM family protein phosphatase